MRAFTLARMRPLGLALSLALAYPLAQALPQGAQVVQGQVAIAPGLIQQSTDKAIVNWQNFSIAAGETLRIQQPNVNAVLLNRVTGGDPSLILGQLQANGRVFLVNPRGIVFGRSSQVDVGGLVASTLNLADADFLAGAYRFSAGAEAGALQADGRITAAGGTVALVSPQLSMGGSIEARRVGLGAGSTVQVDVEGDGLVLFNLRTDDSRDIALKLSGRVLADGGSAELRAQARAGAAGQVLNMDGVVQARGLRQAGGRIVIDGGTAGITTVNGSADVTGETGGSITVLGQKLALLDAARLDASGPSGGGSIQVGGGFQGQGTAHNAERTWIAPGAELRADATNLGDGGRIAVWADERTDLFGSLWARGGRLGGNGGTVETSGRQLLNLHGSVDASAPVGRPGQWLLDPNNITIKSNSSTDVNVGASPNFSSTADGAVVDVGSLNAALNNGITVTVQTTNSGGASVELGNIDVQAVIRPAGAATLNLIALGDITFSSGSINASAGALNVNLQAGGSITASNIITGGGTLSATAPGAIDLGAVTSGGLTVSGGAGSVTLPSGNVSGVLNVSTTGGSVLQNAGNLSVTGLSTFAISAGSGSLALGNFSSGGLTASTSGGAVSLGGGTLAGNLNITTAGGAINQAASGLTVTGTSTLHAGTGSITLSNVGNDFQGAVSLTGASADIVSAKTPASVLQLSSSTLTGNFSGTTAGGAIAQSGTLSVTGRATLDAGSGAITMGSLSTGQLIATSTAASIVLGTGTVSTLTASTAGTGSITQAAGTLNASGAVALTTGTGAITLGGLNSGDFTATTSGGALSLSTGTVNGTLAAVTGGGPITQASGGLTVVGAATLNAGAGAITLADTNDWRSTVDLIGAASLIASSKTATSALNLTSFTTSGPLSVTTGGGAITLGAGSVTGGLTVVSGGGAIGQAGAISVSGNATFAAGVGSVTLGSGASNSFTGGADVGITSSHGTLTLGNLNITGSLTASTGNSAAVQQAAGPITAAGHATLAAGTGGVSLASFSSSGLDVSASGGTITLGTGTISGALNVGANGLVTQVAGGLTVAGAASISASGGAIALTQAANDLQGPLSLQGGTTQIVSAKSSTSVLRLNTSNITGHFSGTTAGGAITQSGALSVTGATTLNAGTGDVTLGLSNQLQDAITLTAGAVQLANAGSTALKLASINTTGNLGLTTVGGGIELGTGSVAGTLTANSNGGAITQAAGTLTVTGLSTLNAGAGSLTLGHFNSGALNATTAGSALRLGTGTIGGPLTVDSAGGTISQAAGGLIVQGDASLSTAVGATKGAITLNDAGNDWRGVVALTGATTQITSTRNAAATLTLGALSTGGLTVGTAGGALNLGAGSIDGTLTASSQGGAISQSGALAVDGIATLDATTAGSITLANASNQWKGLHLTGAALNLGSVGDLEILSLSRPANQALTLSAGADLILGSSANIDTGTADLKLASLGGSFSVGGVLRGANVELQAQTGLFLSKDLTATGTLKLTTNSGGITQSTGTITAAGSTTVSAGSSAISLTGASNNFAGPVSLSGGVTQVTDTGTLTLGTLDTGNLTVTSNGALDLGHGKVDGTLNANSQGHVITQAVGAGLTLTGAATLDAGGANITLSEATNDLGGAITAKGGAVSLRSAGNLHLQALFQPANQALVLEAGGALTLPVGTGNINTGSAALTLSSGTVFTTFGTLSGGDVRIKGQSATLIHDITALGNLDLRTSAGAINQTGGRISVGGTSLIDAGVAAVTLTRPANSFVGGVNLTGGTTQITAQGGLVFSGLAVNSLEAHVGGALQLGSATLSGDLSATAGGAITQATGGLRVAGSSSFTGTTLALDDTANNWGGTVSLTGTAAQLRSTGAVTLGGSSVSSLVLTAAGAVSQSGALSVTGALDLDAGVAAVTLANASNRLGGPVRLTGGTSQISTLGALNLSGATVGALTLQSGGALTLGPSTVSGALVADSGGGAVAQSGVLNVSGAADIEAGAGSITLTQSGNQWGGVLSLRGGAAQVTSGSTLSLGTLAVASLTAQATGALGLGQGIVSGNLTAQSGGGAITQSGALDVGGTSNLQAGSGDITLMAAANRWGNTVSLTGGTAQLTGLGALTLGSVATGDLSATATGALNLGQGRVAGNLLADSSGAITQAGALEVVGSASFNAGSADITLTNTGNRFLGALSLTGNTVALFNQPDLVLGTLSFSSLDAGSGGNITLGTGALTGTLTARALGGSITQAAGGLTVAGVSVLQARDGITLTQASNHFNDTVQLSAGAVTLTNAGALTLSTLATGALTLNVTGALNLGGGSVGGNLDASSTGAITQGSALSISGSSSLNAGGAAITLAQSGNAFGGAVSLRGSTVQLVNSGALSLGTLGVGDLTVDSSGALQLGAGTVSGALVASSGGRAITQSPGGLSVSGMSSLNAGSAAIQLGDAGNAFNGAVNLTAGDVTLNSGTALRLGSFVTRDLTLTAGGNLDLGAGTASGNLSASTRGSRISQAGPLTVQGSATFIADGSVVDLVLGEDANRLLGGIRMQGVNGGSFLSANFSSAQDLSFSGDVQTLTLSSGGRLTLGGGRNTTLTAAARTGIVQTGALEVSGQTTLIAKGGPAMDVDLTHAGNDLRRVALQSQSGGSLARVQLRDGDAVRLDGLQVGGDAAALDIRSAGALDLTGSVLTSLVADTRASGAAITQSGALDVSGSTRFDAGSGALTLTQVGNRWGSPVQLTGGTTQIAGSGALTLGTLATGALTATSAGALDLGQGRITGALTASSRGGAITQSGALQVSGISTLDAGAADITLATAGNRFVGAMSLTGNAVLLVNEPDLVLGALNFKSLDATSNGGITLGSGSLAGGLTARALGGGITQSTGGIAVIGTTTLQATGDITLTDTANRLQGTVNLSGGTTTLANATALGLGQVAAGALALNSSGAITQIGSLVVRGVSSLDAGTFAIKLDQSGNRFTGPVNLRGGNVEIVAGGALTLAGLSVADLKVQSGGALQLGTGRVGGELNANSQGANITQAAGGLSVAGLTTLNAGSASVELSEASNTFSGAVNLTAGDVTLVASTALQLGTFATRSLTLNAGGDVDLGTGTASGNLSASTRGSGIRQTGDLAIQGSSTFIADGGAVNLLLSQPGNRFQGAVQVQELNGGSFLSAGLGSTIDLSFSGDVQALMLSSGGGLTLGGGQSATLTAAARTGITQTGALSVAGQTQLTSTGVAMPVDLTHAGNDLHSVTLQAQAGGSLARVLLRDGDAVGRDGLRVGGNAAALEIQSAGALELTGSAVTSLVADTSASGAAITQSGALQVSGVTLLKAGSGSITLTRTDNQLPSLTVGSAGMASLVSGGDYQVNASSVAQLLDLGGPGSITLSGPLSGSGELLMSGRGSLTVSSAQSYSGGTRIASGRVVLQGPAAQVGTGAVQLGLAGQLDVRDGAVLPNELIAQGGSVLNTSGVGSLAGTVTLLANTSFQPGPGGLTVSGPISDGGAGFGLQLAGAGTLTLSGQNAYLGTTDIAAGTLRANGTGALPATSAVQLAASAGLVLGQDQTVGSLAGAGSVQLDQFTLTMGADGRSTAFSGNMAGRGGITKQGSGQFTWAGTGTHTGATRVQSGELVLATGSALNDTTAVTVEAGARITVQQSASLGSLAGAGTVDVQAPWLSVGGNGASTRWAGVITGVGGLAKQGAGTFTLSGSNTLTGDLQVNAGRLQLDGSGVRPLAAGSVAPVIPVQSGIQLESGAVLELLSDQTLGALSGSGRVLLNPYTLALGGSGRSSRFNGIISGSGGLTKQGAGTLTLGGRNDYTGTTRAEAGSLVLDMAQALPAASALVIDAPARVQVNAAQVVASLTGSGSLALTGASLAAGSDGQDSRFDGEVSGSGGLVKQGAGTLTLTAANTQSGATSIEAGAIRLTNLGTLGSGDVQNQGQLLLSRGDALTLDQAISGSGSLVISQGQVTLTNAANRYSGATQVLGGSLITTASDRLPDASAVEVAANAQLQVGGNETIASLQAVGSVRLAGSLTTAGEQVYSGSLTLSNPAGITLSGTLIDAGRSTNQFSGTPLGLAGGQARVTVKETLKLGDVSLSNGGRIEAERLALDGKLQLSGGTLSLVATAAPDDAKATLLGTAQVPTVGQPLAVAEAMVQQGVNGAITVTDGASLQVQASGGGSVLLGQDANSFNGALSVLSGTGFDTAWTPNVKGAQAVQSLVRVSGQQVLVGGSGIEADLIYIRADQLATTGTAKLVARLPFDEIVLGKALSAPGLTLELAPGAFGLPDSFGSVTGQPIQVEVGSTQTGARTSGPNAGYVTVLPKAAAQGATAVVLVGPKVGSVAASGGAGYRFFHDGSSQAVEIPVVYNGVLPLTPAASGAISSINGDAEDARRARFQETVRTENVTVRLRSGVIAEVGPGRASTQGREGAAPALTCEPANQPPLSCK